MTEKLTINNKGIRNNICLSSSYKFTLKKINKKIILIIVIDKDPNVI